MLDGDYARIMEKYPRQVRAVEEFMRRIQPHLPLFRRMKRTGNHRRIIKKLIEAGQQHHQKSRGGAKPRDES